MRKTLVGVAVLAVLAAAMGLAADDDFSHRFHFAPDTLVVSRSVYVGTASTVTIGQTLPPGCVAGKVSVPTTTPPTITSVTIPSGSSSGCNTAIENGEYPNLSDTHNVWNNDNADGSFGVTSPIYLDNLTEDGQLLDTLPIPSNLLVTSFSSKSELALNRSTDGRSITFGAYHGGPGCPVITFTAGVGVQGASSGPISPTAPNLLDVSNANTPGVCDPTNPVVSSDTSNPTVPTAYYRAVGEVDAYGYLRVTDGNAYSGNNGRAAIKANWLYYMVGNDNNGGLSKSQLPTTPIGVDLTTSTGTELVVPGQTPPVPPNINMVGDFEVTQLGLPADKAGKDNNFRGLTIFGDTFYVTKGSGSNGVNTVYQVGAAGVLPTTSNAPGTPPSLKNVPITILPGFSTTLASGTSPAFPFGIWFANATTLYVCDEGDDTLVTGQANGNVADAATFATAGVQKWLLVNGTWVREYVLQDGLNIGVPYSIANYPTSINPATDGCRNLTGRVNGGGTVTLWVVTSTVSANGDQGADPNKLVKVTDLLKATALPKSDGDHDKGDSWGYFTTIRTARAGEVLRGVTLAPVDADYDRYHDHDDHDGDRSRR